jgi:hypothetical protein
LAFKSFEGATSGAFLVSLFLLDDFLIFSFFSLKVSPSNETHCNKPCEVLNETKAIPLSELTWILVIDSSEICGLVVTSQAVRDAWVAVSTGKLAMKAVNSSLFLPSSARRANNVFFLFSSALVSILAWNTLVE